MRDIPWPLVIFACLAFFCFGSVYGFCVARRRYKELANRIFGPLNVPSKDLFKYNEKFISK